MTIILKDKEGNDQEITRPYEECVDCRYLYEWEDSGIYVCSDCDWEDYNCFEDKDCSPCDNCSKGD